MKIEELAELRCSDEQKLKETPASISQYEVLKLIAYRFKDVKSLFPKKRAMAEEFIKNVKF